VSPRGLPLAAALSLLLVLVACGKSGDDAGPSREVIKFELRKELRPELKRELKTELKQELRVELKAELKGELKAELKHEIIADFRAARGAVAKAPAAVVVRPTVASKPAVAAPAAAAPVAQPGQPQPAPPKPEVAAAAVQIPPGSPAGEIALPAPTPAPTPPPATPPTAAAPAAAKDPAAAAKPEAKASEVVILKLQVAKTIDREKRLPVGVAKAFDVAQVNKVYAYVIAKNLAGDDKVTVEWSFGGNVVSRIQLRVGPSTLGWRTWSSARLTPTRKGKWTVRILSSDAKPKQLAQTAFLAR